MPSNSIVEQFQTQFESQLHYDAAQTESLLKGRIEQKPVNNAQTFIYNRLGNTEDIEIFDRLGATVAQEATHAVRGVSMRDFRCTLLVDNFDMLQTAVDVKSGYSKVAAETLLRRYDRLGLAAAQASVKTTKNLGTTVSAATDGVVTIAHGGTGLTFAKVLTMQKNFIASGALKTGTRINCAITANQHADLMQEVELTSGDYVRDFPIENGVIKSRLGIDFIIFPSATNISNPIVTKSGTTRSCVAWIGSPMESGICLGVNKPPSVEIDKRPDLNNAWQIQVSFFAAALRTEGVKVQIVECTES
jgi:hypothetical protein